MGAFRFCYKTVTKCKSLFRILDAILLITSLKDWIAWVYICDLIFFFHLRWKLDRDSARWKLPPAEVQKRRALFWELFITDCWQVCRPMATAGESFLTKFFGRASQLVDYQRIRYPLLTASCHSIPTKQLQKMARHSRVVSVSIVIRQVKSSDSVSQVPFWKARFGAECVSAVVQGTLQWGTKLFQWFLYMQRLLNNSRTTAAIDLKFLI